MAVLPILVYPDPLLKQVSQPVSWPNPELDRIIFDLFDTMYDGPGCVGVAAPQCSIHLRIIVIDASRNPRVESRLGKQVLINPTLVSQEGEVLAREGCLSFPHLTANVIRAKNIRVKAFNEKQEELLLEASDFEARLILHELDHIDGILFLDRVACLKTDVFRRKRYAPAESK